MLRNTVARRFQRLEAATADTQPGPTQLDPEGALLVSLTLVQVESVLDGEMMSAN